MINLTSEQKRHFPNMMSGNSMADTKRNYISFGGNPMDIPHIYVGEDSETSNERTLKFIDALNKRIDSIVENATTNGYATGYRYGMKDANLVTKEELESEKKESYANGYDTGYSECRDYIEKKKATLCVATEYVFATVRDVPIVPTESRKEIHIKATNDRDVNLIEGIIRLYRNGQRIHAIKLFREITNCGLKQSSDLLIAIADNQYEYTITK